jgi:hypothetical protein
MRRLSLGRFAPVIAVGAITFGLTVAAAASLNVNALQLVPAQGSAEVAGVCTDSVGAPSIRLSLSDGGTTIAAVEVTTGAGVLACGGWRASLEIDSTTYTGPTSADYSSGIPGWRFPLASTVPTAEWSTGTGATVIIYEQ